MKIEKIDKDHIKVITEKIVDIGAMKRNLSDLEKMHSELEKKEVKGDNFDKEVIDKINREVEDEKASIFIKMEEIKHQLKEYGYNDNKTITPNKTK